MKTRSCTSGAAVAWLALATVGLSGCIHEPPYEPSTPAEPAPALSTTATTTVPAPKEPYVLVLGTAQDGGLPHIGCDSGNCAAVKRDPSRRRLVTALMLCDPRSGKRWLFDCTPDLREQLDRAKGQPASRATASPRPPAFDGMFLTHAHMGHYGGLLQLGREALGIRDVPTYVTPRFAAFLLGNDPWRLMVTENRLILREIAPGRPVELAPDLHVDCFRVPHRDEFSDTVGFVIRGPHKSLVYLPDIDKWEKWDTWGADATAGTPDAVAQRIETVIERVDYALLDGCFHADGEIPGRSMKDIPHPFISESVERFQSLAPALRDRVWFTHLNHTNAAADPRSEASRAVTAAGMHVLDEGHVFGL